MTTNTTTAPTFAAAVLAALDYAPRRPSHVVEHTANNRVDVYAREGHHVEIVARFGGVAHLTADDGEGYAYGSATLTNLPASVVAATAIAMLDGVDA